jgi:hypothetical protein
VARRWTRQGRDRLYVLTAGGDRVGWVDMVTGQAVLQKAVHAIEFSRTVRSWRGANGEVAKLIPALSSAELEYGGAEAARPTLPSNERNRNGEQPNNWLRPLQPNSPRSAAVRRLARLLSGDTDDR